jgi:molecular chaperone GrpE
MVNPRHQSPDGDEARSAPDRDSRNSRGPGGAHDQTADAAAQTQQIEISDEAAEIVRQLQAELDEAVEARKRALADFRNYQRRALESEQKALEAGTARAVRALLPVIDNFDLILAQKPDQMTTEQLLKGVQIVRSELSKALQTQGVRRIEPARGEPFDPHQHEAVMRQPADDLEPNSVVATMQSGFALGDLVLRPAKVSVSPGSEE